MIVSWQIAMPHLECECCFNHTLAETQSAFAYLDEGPQLRQPVPIYATLNLENLPIASPMCREAEFRYS